MYIDDLLAQCSDILDPLSAAARDRVEQAVHEHWDAGFILDRDAITLLALQQAPGEYDVDDSRFDMGGPGETRGLPMSNLGFVPAPKTAEQRDAIARRVIADRQARVDAALERGAQFVLSHAEKVHTLECPSSGYVYDQWHILDLYSGRREGPQFVNGQLVSSILHGYQPADPRLLTRDEVLALTTRYSRCRVCAPDVPELAPRRPGDEPWTLERITTSLAKPGYSKSKPHRALADVVTAHRADDQQPCPVDGEPSPCRTMQIVLGAYGAG